MDWNQEAITEQVERLESRERQEKKYEGYFVIGAVVLAVGIIIYHFRDMCPVSAREGKYFDVNDFITPDKVIIRTIATEIQQGSIESNVVAALEYVNQNVTYVSDKVQYGYDECWAFPVETLESGYGDCEDYSMLLASILLALNLPSETVRVSLGVKDGTGHAWTEVLLDQWYVLEGARGIIIAVEDAKGYSVDCYVYRNKCETINAARYGLHNLVDPLEALATIPNITMTPTRVNDEGYIKDMWKLIAETARDTRERTFSFCRKDGINTTDINVGDRNEVYLKECEEGEKVGDFHTHLETSKFSVADLINLVSQRNGFSCVGAAAENKISCLELNPTEEGFDQWQQRLYTAAEEPLELRDVLVHSDRKDWLDVYNTYTIAVVEFDSVVKDGMNKGYLVDSTVELLQQLSNLMKNTKHC